MAFARQVVESHVAAHVIDREIKRIPRLLDIYDGIKWRLARQPEVGYRVPQTSPQIYVVHSYHFKIGKAVVVAYHFTEDEVTILDARVVDQPRDRD